MSEYIIDMSNSSYQSTSGLLSADVSQLREEVVRCRDCKHCREHDMRAYGGDRDQFLCHHFSMSSSAGWPVELDGFCAWGKERTPNG